MYLYIKYKKKDGTRWVPITNKFRKIFKLNK